MSTSERTGTPGATVPDRRPASNRGSRWLAASTPAKLLGVGLCVLALAALSIVSIAVGSKPIGLGEVLNALWNNDGSQVAAIVHELRLPRTALALVVGLALGVAGAVMQALTRNPLADPGLLGVNAGAAAAVVVGIAIFGVGSALGYLPFAFAGAALASIVVYLLGSAGRSGATPVRLALAGTAVTAALSAVIEALIVLDPTTFDRYRFWAVGSIAGRGPDILAAIVPFVALGVLIAFGVSRALNVLALGDELGRALGAGVTRTRVLAGLTVTLLAGSATAAAGPIFFIGLAVPHLARAITGPDNRWVLLYSALLAPLLLLAADIIGRLVVRPGELGVGIVTAALGAPVFIALVCGRRVAQL